MEEKQWTNYEVTNHAKERYAERIMGRDTIADTRVFVKEHNQDIVDWINKLVNYGTLLYTGAIGDHPITKAYLKDYWCILVDAKINRVITLYKIDLGDDEVNEIFLSKMLQKIEDAKEDIIKTQQKTEEEVSEYQNLIATNEADIQQLKNKIKSLETINEGYKLIIKGAKEEIDAASYKVRTLVEQLIAKRNF